METIDLQHNWKQHMRLITVILTNGNPQGQAWARAELDRIAEALEKAFPTGVPE